MGKSLVKNSIYNVFYKILNIVFPLITSAYVARILMADSIGKVAAAQNIVSYFTLVAAMGIPTYGVKLIAQYKIKSRESGKAFLELFLINGMISIVCSLAYYIFILTSPYFDGKEFLYCITGLNVIFNVINVDWFYQGIQEYGYIAVRSFVIKCLSLLSLIIFVRDQDDYIIYAFISSAALVGNYLFNIVRIRKYVSFRITNLEFEEHIRHILVLFAATVAAEVYVLADTTMLDYLCDSSTVGYYTMSMRIIKLLRSLVVAVSAVFLPQLSYFYFNKQQDAFFKLANKGLHILMVLTIPAALGIMVVADDAILTLFGRGFTDSILTTRILSVSVLTVAVSNFIGLQILVTIGKEKITTISTICGAVINIILNFFLIIRFQQNGAAVASVITEGSVMAIQLILSRRYIKLKFDLSKIIISAACMVLAVFAVRLLPLTAALRLCLSCLVGMAVYGGILILLRESFAMSLWDGLRQKIRG